MGVTILTTGAVIATVRVNLALHIGLPGPGCCSSFPNLEASQGQDSQYQLLALATVGKT